jgi:hypothetical protein
LLTVSRPWKYTSGFWAVPRRRGAVGRQAAGAVGAPASSSIIAHDLARDLLDLLDFVRGAEAVEEVQEGHARLQRGGLGDQGQSMTSCTLFEASMAKPVWRTGHDVGVVAEDRQALAGQRAGETWKTVGSVRRRSCTCWGSSAAGPARR